MPQINSKSSLAIALSGLKGFEKPKVREEQYITEPEIAADVIWMILMREQLNGKTVADLGSGTGILGLGCLLAGASKVFLVEKDENAMLTAKQNYELLKSEGYKLGDAEFILSDINGFKEKADIVLQNPPFGTKDKHADREFLEKAFSTAGKVFSFHKTSTEQFVRAFAESSGFHIEGMLDFKFPLHHTQNFHTRRIHRIEVTLFALSNTKPQ